MNAKVLVFKLQGRRRNHEQFEQWPMSMYRIGIEAQMGNGLAFILPNGQHRRLELGVGE
jgi:hypothetical protein